MTAAPASRQPDLRLELETPRLRIRPYRSSDLDDVYEVLRDPAVFWWVSEPFTRERAAVWLADEIAFVERDNAGRHAVVLRETGEVIGGVGLVPRDLQHGREIELGYHLRHDLWGNGYATEAGQACVAQAAASGLNRIIALIYVDNPRSEAVARRLGFAPEGRLLWAGLPHRLWARTLAAGLAAGPALG